MPLQLPAIPQCPLSFQGTLSRFFDDHVAPNLPTSKAAEAAHAAVLAYTSSPGPLLVRKFKGYQLRGKIHDGVDGTRFVCSDNEAAVWFWTQVRLERVTGPNFIVDAMRDKRLPVGMSTKPATGETRADWPCWGAGDAAWKFRGGGRWKHAHILDAAGLAHMALDRRTLRAASIRLLHPLNHFVFPTKFRRDSGGYFREQSDPAEDVRIQAWVAARLRRMYGALFDDFWQRALGELDLANAPTDVEIQFKWLPAVGASEDVNGNGTTAQDDERVTGPLVIGPPTAIGPASFPVFSRMVEHLRQWISRTRGSPGETRINGTAAGSDPTPWVCFFVGGFLAGDGISPGLNGERFNTTFFLAGDTQRRAVERFLDLYDECSGDVRRIFDPGPSNGVSLKLYLRVREGRNFKGWNCLDDRGGGRRGEQLRKRIESTRVRGPETGR